MPQLSTTATVEPDSATVDILQNTSKGTDRVVESSIVIYDDVLAFVDTDTYCCLVTIDDCLQGHVEIV